MGAEVNVDDMTNLVELSELSILENLKRRYDKQIIYTYTGSILVAMNPFKSLSIYEMDAIKLYNNTPRPIQNCKPHIFAIAETAYSNIKSSSKANQAVIISGESGAGKTESTKLILQYLTSVTENKTWVQQQIMEANTILESFGNAKTVRNNNSSRFGKFIKLQFNQSCGIIGAILTNYLLEKSRVVSQMANERNYHIFYQLTVGASDEERTTLSLPPKAPFQYITGQSLGLIPEQHDKKDYQALKLALNVLNMSPENMSTVFSVLSGILHLGNVTYSEGEDNKPLNITNTNALAIAAKLFQVSEEKLTECLRFRRLTVRGESTMVPLKMVEAIDTRDSISKGVYGNLFQWIVDFINESIKPKENSAVFIGVLDIFGFECFDTNSFEQFCINYTNEKLQQFFCQFIFKLEQDEYTKEEIRWDSISFKDNQACIDMIEMKMGILALLDEECRFPKGTDESFLQKMHEKLDKTEFYVKPRQAKPIFGIKHYAGEVTYTITAFLEKNKDNVPDEVYELFLGSKLDLVRALFKDGSESGNKTNTTNKKEEAGAKKKPTAGAQFKAQLVSLVTTLGETTPHYVRCVKPNNAKQAFAFEDEMVLAQLRYSGMLETIRIRKAGYSTRIPFDQFVSRYKPLAAGVKGKDPKIISQAIMDGVGLSKDHYQVGKTKVFMRPSVFVPLQEKIEKLLSAKAIIIQRMYRGWRQRRRYKKMKVAIKVLQKHVKGFVYRRKYKRTKDAALKIQSVIRGWFARDYYRQLKREKLAKEAAPPPEPEESVQAKKAEEAQIVELTKQTHLQLNNSIGDGSIDNLFSFLGDFRAATQSDDVQEKEAQKALSNVVQNLNLELDDIVSRALSEHTLNVDLAASTANLDMSTKNVENLKPRELKANPLRKKEEKISNSKDALAEQVNFNEWPMLNYASKFFEIHDKASGTIGTFRKKRNSGFNDELLYYTKNPIIVPMLKFQPGVVPDEATVLIAIEIFKELLKILDGKISKVEEQQKIIQRIIKAGIEKQELRDEIFVQLIRQTTPPPKDKPKGFEKMQYTAFMILAYALSSFPPNKSLSKYLLAHIQRTLHNVTKAETDAEVDKACELCETTFRQTMLNGARRFPPSLVEMEAMKMKRPIICKIYFLDGQIKSVGIQPSSVAADIVKDLAKKIDLPETTGWSLFEDDGKEIRVVRSTTRPVDILAKWEAEKFLEGPIKPGTISGKAAAAALQSLSSEPRLLLQRRLFKTPQQIPTNPVEYNLIYAQAVSSFLKDEFPIVEKILPQLSALKAQVVWGDFQEGQKSRYSDLTQYVPHSLYDKKDGDVWRQLISEAHQKLKGTPPLKAKVLFLEAIKQFKLYGSTQFQAKYIGFWSNPENIRIAVGVNGIFFVHNKNKSILNYYPYAKLKGWEVDGGDKVALYILKESVADADESDDTSDFDTYAFSCKQADEVASLIKEYSPAHRAPMSSEMRPRTKSTALVEGNMETLQKDVEKAREVLLSKKILRVPGPSSTGPSVGTVKLLKRTSAVLSGSMGYTEADWSFSKNKLGTSLSVIDDSEQMLIDECVRMHEGILAYAGYISPLLDFDSISNVPFIGMIQYFLGRAIDNKIVADELYLQLVKMTTNHHEPSSKPATQIWRFFCIASGAVAPSHDILEYVRAHLRKHSAGSASTAIFAKFALKTLSRLQAKGPRICPPCTKEIGFSAAPGPFYARFYTADDQFRAARFDSSSTVDELLDMIKTKLSIKYSPGWSLFEIFGTMERPSNDSDKISDLAYKWERYAAENNLSQSVKFVMRKRIFVRPFDRLDNPVEEGLIYAQAIDDVINGRYPVNESEAIYLAALRAQTELGDHDPSKNHDYSYYLEKYVPPSVLRPNMEPELAKRHAELQGTSKSECDELYMKHIRSWPYYGSSVFPVTQSYTDQYPSKLWLAVNFRGIHIFAVNGKTALASYPYKSIVSYSPSQKSIMIVTESLTRGTKFVFHSGQATQIAHLMHDYLAEIEKSILAYSKRKK